MSTVGALGAGTVAPLLGNPRVTPSTPSAGAARWVRGISDRAGQTLGGGSVPTALIDPQSPVASRLRSAIGGVFDRLEWVRDAATSLRSTVDEGTRFGSRLDAEVVVERTEALIASINELRDFVNRNPDTLATRLIDRIDVATSSHELRSALHSIGISIDAGGTLTLNDETLHAQITAQPDVVATTLGRAAGLAQRELDTTTELLETPTVSIVGFDNPLKPSYLLTETTPAQLELAGRFVDLLI